MKLLSVFTISLIVFSGFLSNNVSAQDETGEESPFSIGADIYSNYIWRGTKFGGPSIQPSVSVTFGGFTAGIWGSYGLKTGSIFTTKGDTLSGLSSYFETDPYIAYEFPFGLSIGVTNYYYEGDFTNLSDTLGSHAFEANLGYSIKGMWVKANYIINQAGGAGSLGGDMYFELGYDFKNFGAFVGAGNGWHTLDIDGKDKFNICNIGLQATKDITVTETFTIPVTGQIVVNPDTKGIYMAVGLSF